MSRPRHLKLAATIALWAAVTVALVAWAWHPARVLTASGPHDAVVARDGELAWTLNLGLDPEDRAEWPVPTASQPGSFAWRDERTCVFTPAGALPADGELSVAFPADLRAAGGFRFAKEAVPSFRVRTLPAVAVTGASAASPAFGDPRIELALNRLPADAAALFGAVTVEPPVATTAAMVDGRLRLTGAFAPGVGYRVRVEAPATGRIDDRPAVWQGEVAVPLRTPGARLAAAVGRQAFVEGVNLPFVVVEAADGRRACVAFRPHAGDAPARAELPAGLLGPGENRLRLRWTGGEAEAVLQRHDLRLAPDDAVPALLGGTLPVVSAR